MMHKLKELLARVETWPTAVQEKAAASLDAVEQEYLAAYELSQADLQAVDRGLRAAEEGRFAADAEVEAVFARYREAGRSGSPRPRLPNSTRSFPISQETARVPPRRLWRTSKP
jgi:predicted transcriptional regulator